MQIPTSVPQQLFPNPAPLELPCPVVGWTRTPVDATEDVPLHVRLIAPGPTWEA